MALAAVPNNDDLEPAVIPTPALGAALISLASRLGAEEARWLAMLAEFDRREGWKADGQLSCVDWLELRCGITRRTARDKLRVAHALLRRPLLADAFASGALSYAKVRAMTRITDANAETDQYLLQLAAVGTAGDLERVAHKWKELRDQERGMDPYLRRWDRRTLRASRTFDGMGVVEAVMPVEQLEEFLALVDSGSAEPQSTGQRRLDGLLDVVRSGAASADAPLSERYMVHVVGDLDALAGTVGARAELLEGTPISVETLRRMTCDAPLVRHVLKGDSEPLDVGRRSSVWTTAQRRAIVVRDKGHCRFPGCWRRTADVHHIVYYGDGGETNVNNGLLLCPKHHTLVHEGGFSIEGDANTACFLDPRGCEVWPRV